MHSFRRTALARASRSAFFGRRLFAQGIKIHFAHRTFAWESEARGKAHVHVVIIGFGAFDFAPKHIYEYEAASSISPSESNDGKSEQNRLPRSRKRQISVHILLQGRNCSSARSKPISPVPEIVFGSMPNDGGHLLMTRAGRDVLFGRNRSAAKYLRRFVGAEEFLNGIERWCLWLHGENARRISENAGRDGLRACGHKPSSEQQAANHQGIGRALRPSFGEIRQPDCSYLLIPSVSSERRRYIPIGFMRPDIIASNLVLLVPGAKLYHFGVLSSAMHMAWVRQVSGRLESRYRYSNRIVYNNFPWPVEPTEAAVARVEEAAQQILDLRVELGDGRAGFLPARKKSSNTACLADLYGTESMPFPLYKAHRELDRRRGPLLPPRAVHYRASTGRIPLRLIRETDYAAVGDRKEKTQT